jgi:hydrogenase nickel incorporation protein HypA/HybF
MHELGLAMEIVSIVQERSGGAKVLRVVLEVGKLTAVLPDAIQFCFDVAAKDTVVEGAVLEIVETPAVARCLGCGDRVEASRPFARCRCGGTEMDWISGEELKIRAMEVA